MVIYTRFSPRQAIGSLIVSAALLLCGCSNSHNTQALFHPDDAQSQQQLLLQLQCSGKQPLTGDALTPPALYQRMNQCVAQNNYRAATLLFSLAGSYSWYDSARVDTPFAKKQHTELLADALDQQGSEQRDKLWGHIQSTLGDPQQLKVVCQNVRMIGRPRYQAVYMQQPDATGSQDYAAWPRWNAALESYLHCPVNGS